MLVKLKGTQIQRCVAAYSRIRFTGEKTESGGVAEREIDNSKFRYAIFKTGQAISDVHSKMEALLEGHQKALMAPVKVRVEDSDGNAVKDDKGKLQFRQRNEFRTVKDQQKYRDFEKKALDDTYEVKVHSWKKDDLTEFEEDYPDIMFDVYEFDFCYMTPEAIESLEPPAKNGRAKRTSRRNKATESDTE